MNRRHIGHLAAVLALGLAIRLLAYRWVGIWVDHGFYPYDARLILRGQTPFVDFLGRSPLWLYLYAGVQGLLGYSVAVVRGFVVGWWLVAALPVYGLGREIADHRSGLAAVGVYWLLPYGIVYGFWVNTMSLAAALSVTAVYLLATRDRVRWWAVAGLLIGLAFLSRRSAVVLLPALGLFLLLHDADYSDNWNAISSRLGALTAAWIGTLLVSYWLVVGGSLSQTVALAETHALNLFISTGRGGWPLLGASVPNPGNSIDAGRIPIFNDVCQLCGRWTARTIAKGLLVAMPAVAIATGGGLRYVTRRWFDPRGVPYLMAPLALLGLFAAALAAFTGYWLRVGAVVSLAVGVWLAYRVELPTPTVRDRPALLLALLAGGGMVAGYLYRERALHVYYGMDVWPYGSVAVGLVAIAFWDRFDSIGRGLFVGLLAVAVITSGAAAYPLANVAMGNEAGWYTTETLPEMQDEIESRTEAGDVVLSKSATPLAGTGARMPLDDSRGTAHLFSVFQASGPVTAKLYPNLTRNMRAGEVELVLEDSLIRNLIAANATLTGLYTKEYCRVNDASTQRLFASANTTLYQHRPDCPSHRRPVINATAD